MLGSLVVVLESLVHYHSAVVSTLERQPTSKGDKRWLKKGGCMYREDKEKKGDDTLLHTMNRVKVELGWK